jgi:hypothetical protein
MQRSHSEFIARIFEIADYILLIPTTFIVIFWLIPIFLYGGLLSLAAIISGQAILIGVLFFVSYLALIGFAVLRSRLLIGYHRHSRGKLNQNQIDKLLLKTICYNSPLFLSSFYFHLNCWITEVCVSELLFEPVVVSLTILCGTRIILSFMALFPLEIESGENAK